MESSLLVFGNRKRMMYLLALLAEGPISGHFLRRKLRLDTQEEQRITKFFITARALERIGPGFGKIWFHDRFVAAVELRAFLAAVAGKQQLSEGERMRGGTEHGDLRRIFGSANRTAVLMVTALSEVELDAPTISRTAGVGESSARHAASLLVRDGLFERVGHRFLFRRDLAVYDVLVPLIKTLASTINSN